MSKPKIKPVEDNKSKSKTYAALMSNYKKAIEEEYYGEAELIVYAYMEDQLRAFLYYSQALDARNGQKINDKMASIHGQRVSVNNISAKIDIIKEAFKACNDENLSDNEYVKFLKAKYKASINIREFESNLKKIRKWCDYRNEIVHAMFNKDIDSLRKGYKEHIESGFQLGRYIDNKVKALRRA